MSGYVFAFGSCWSCGRPFTFDPDRVPSIPVDSVTHLPPDLGGDATRAQREPICERCIERANVKRKANGLDPIVVLPGAYAPLGD